MMNKIVYGGLGAVAILSIGLANSALAAPKGAAGDGNVVANYDSGAHGIPGEYYLHEGSDVVTKSGKSGNFQQWFSGTTSLTGSATVGEHTVWKVSKDGTCDSGWFLVPDASASWGDYLVAGADYCVKTNNY